MSNFLISIAVLAAICSNILKPIGRVNSIQDAKFNALRLSPFRSGILIVIRLIELINWRLSNLASFHAGLWLLARLHFQIPEGLRDVQSPSRATWSCWARRSCLVNVTLPLFIILIRLPCHWGIHTAVALLVMESFFDEFLICYLQTSCSGLVFRRNWPTTALVGKSFFTSDQCDQVSHAETQQCGREGHISTSPSHPAGDNLCDRVRRIWTPESTSHPNKATGDHPFEDVPNLDAIFATSAPSPSQWTCVHRRCHLYMTLRSSIKPIAFSSIWLDLALAAWLIHNNLRAPMLYAARVLLAERTLKDLLTLAYLSSLLIPIYVSVYVFWARVFPLLCNRLNSLNRLSQKFEVFFQRVPIAYKIGLLLNALGVCCGVYPVLLRQDPVLSEGVLSYILEIGVASIICRTIYRYTLGSSKATTSGSLRGQGSINPDTEAESMPSTGLKEPTNMDHYLQKDCESSERQTWLHLFRLALLLPNLVIWSMS
ncbi:hypothetical protein N7462_006990 [Penicillium macrosclerotiorum]|uniref:uncharacterized protein n=1 Tax=Penicillium macrosclerotiorum TaxID=303699 RepID=UPI0025478A64|nr:uncharacterized protein N7462_006990 [Penicillium macrosclerotiorum]KAJ5678746.1 hypothetical protein N7462_006990 [Penicillium macrosclerotiorum]